MNRRSFLLTAGAGVSVALAGCSSSAGSPPDQLADVEEDPDQLPTPTIGSSDVPIDVYEDLGCPACQQFNAQIFPAIEEFLVEPGAASYRHYDFPVPAHDRSFAMANAARAVQDDTRTDDDPNGAFFAYKAEVFATEDWSDENLASIADEVDADPDAVAAALEDDTYYPTLVADWRRGADNGVGGTPTVFVDGTEVENHSDTEEIAGLVQDAQ